jgi:ribulose-phosphate 3-epimerase
VRISPSVASCNQVRIEEEIYRIQDQYSDLHIDIEDGNFTPNITFGLKMLRAIRNVTELPFSVHLMVTNPEQYIDELAQLNCSYIFVHAESSMYLKRILHAIRSKGIKAGIALNPCSDIKNYEYLTDDFDAVLYMTSEMDGQGERFQKRVLDKMQPIKDKEIWVDGGINAQNMNDLPNYIDVMVMGRAVFAK